MRGSDLRLGAALVGTLLVTLPTSCALSAEDSAGRADVAGPESFTALELLRQTVAFDYQPYPSVAALREDVRTAILGTVSSVGQGQLDRNGEQLVGENLGVILLTVKVTEDLKDEGAPGGELVVALPRPNNMDLTVYERDLPPGTPVAVFADLEPAPLVGADGGGEVLFPAAQGLFLEDGEDGPLVSVWGDPFEEDPPATIDTFDELAEAAAE